MSNKSPFANPYFYKSLEGIPLNEEKFHNNSMKHEEKHTTNNISGSFYKKPVGLILTEVGRGTFSYIDKTKKTNKPKFKNENLLTDVQKEYLKNVETQDDVCNAIIAFSGNTTPGDSCYINEMSTDTFHTMLGFLQPRELCGINSVNTLFKTMVLSIGRSIFNYFCEGRVAYFAYNNVWNLGFIMCSNIKECSFHVYIKGDVCIGYKNIISHHTLNKSVVCPNNDKKQYNHEFDGIHNICHCGYRPGYPCGRHSSPFPPSSCNILFPCTSIKLDESMLGNVLNISNLPLNAKHKSVAYSREIEQPANIFGTVPYNSIVNQTDQNNMSSIELLRAHIYNIH
jgi:hypothetical protein